MTYEEFKVQISGTLSAMRRFSREGNDSWYDAALDSFYATQEAHPEYAERLEAEIQAEIEAEDAAREAHYEWLAEQDARTAAI